jgi:hypothetical protein
MNILHQRHVSAYTVAIFRTYSNVRTNTGYCTCVSPTQLVTALVCLLHNWLLHLCVSYTTGYCTCVSPTQLVTALVCLLHNWLLHLCVSYTTGYSTCVSPTHKCCNQCSFERLPKAARTRTSLASESGWARVPLSQTGPCVECHEPDCGRLCIYIYMRAWLPSQAPRGELATQTRTCMGTLRPEDGYTISRNMSPM